IRANASSDLLWEGIHAQSPIGIVIAARELGKMESNEVFCGAVEEEEGGEKLVEMEIMMSNQGVDHVIEKKKTNHVMVVLSDEVEADDELEVDFNVMDQPDDLTLVRPSRSGAMTAISTARRSLYSAPIAVTAALCRDQSGAMTAIGTARRSL
ncbi:hypothetical protein L249_5987, partial [Ophiocordyceps polyrhachis-furcata BCC 54312]